MENLLKDVRYTLRLLWKSPVFTLAAVVSLALGIGVNTTIFSLVNAVLLRPLPVTRPGELVEVYTSSEDQDVLYATSSYPDYLDLARQNAVLTGLAGHSLMFAPVTRDGRSEILMGEIVTANYFDLLGVGAVAGRTFAPDEGGPGAKPAAVIGYGLWQREYGGDPSAVGRSIRLRGTDYTIVGVAPKAFEGMTPGFSPLVWVTAAMMDEVSPVGMIDAVPSPGRTKLEQRGWRWMFLTGRLKPGVSASEAQADLNVIAARLAREYPGSNRDRKMTVVARGDVRVNPLVDGSLSAGATLLMGVVALVLLIACANVANLLLARATARRREIAVRLAVGAGRGRLVRQLLTESLVLSALGGLGGLLLASISTDLLLALQPPLPFTLTLDLGLDQRVFLFALLAAAVSGVAFGLAPALRASSANLVTNLKDDGAVVERTGRFPLRQALVVGQVTVSMVLLVAAGLFVRSLAAARTIDLGFDPQRIALVSTDLKMVRYDEAKSRRFFHDALERVRALPGVEAASLTQREPLGLNINNSAVLIDGQQASPEHPAFTIDSTVVSPGYFATLGVPILQGRAIAETDTADAPGVAVINEAMARRFWPDRSPIGQRVRTIEGGTYEIVGVCADYKVRTVGEAPRPYIHFAHAQDFNRYAVVMVRTRGSAAAMAATLRQTLLGMEPNLVLLASQPLEASLAASLFPARAAAVLVGVFGLLALALAAVGLYGVVAYSVARRTREIGIRMAVGAEPAAVLRLVLGQGLKMAAIGVAAGGTIALWATKVVAGTLYGVGTTDPVTYLGAAALLLAVSAAANAAPALRAARVDPMIALRQP